MQRAAADVAAGPVIKAQQQSKAQTRHVMSMQQLLELGFELIKKKRR